MHRFYSPQAPEPDGALLLAGGEAHHALRVLRLRAGEMVSVLNGAGREFFCVVAHTARDHLRLTVQQTRCAPQLPCQISLIQAIPKGKLFESVIQKATELGVARILPILTERTVVQLDPPEAARKAAKWQGIAVEAIKQCGAAWLPKVETPASLEAVLKRNEGFELPLVGALLGERSHPREYVDRFRAQHHRLPASACAWVGPEGDFTPAELDQIRAAGALPVTLGSLVLRTDTAALYFLSILNYELQFNQQSSAPEPTP